MITFFHSQNDAVTIFTTLAIIPRLLQQGDVPLDVEKREAGVAD